MPSGHVQGESVLASMKVSPRTRAGAGNPTKVSVTAICARTTCTSESPPTARDEHETKKGWGNASGHSNQARSGLARLYRGSSPSPCRTHDAHAADAGLVLAEHRPGVEPIAKDLQLRPVQPEVFWEVREQAT